MSVFRLSLDISEAGRSGAGLVYAGMSLQFDGFTFPNAKWTDFVVVVLSWWAAASTRLISGKTYYEEMRFMDGPFLLEFKNATPGFWRVKCVEAGVNGKS